MSTQEYLLTYKLNDRTDFGWFETKEDMDDFIEATEGIEILDALYIVDAISVR